MATKPGECALLCPACPQPDINLPVRWELHSEDKQYVPYMFFLRDTHACRLNRWLYTLFLGIDGNFKLKRKRVSSDEQDPALSDGWAYMVEERAMNAHLEKNRDYKQEVSNGYLGSLVVIEKTSSEVRASIITQSTTPTRKRVVSQLRVR